MSVEDANRVVVAQGVTNTFGYYVTGTVAIDQTYNITVTHKQYIFERRTLFLFEDVSGFDFVGQQ